ncbi:MAG TPA: hypothetical protein VMU25_03295 [Candidatus Paceibacterota bacterium]|nr:hypothetical protein [Candidatus Paceibacterota bacterium]
MKFGALFGWGIVIYALATLTWSGMTLYGFTAGIVPRLIEALVIACTCIVAGNSLRYRTWKDIMPYSIVWALVVAILDGIFTYPSQGLALYSEWISWVGYALVALLPLCAPYFRRTPSPDRTWET